MDRHYAFYALADHPMLGKIYGRLTKQEVLQCQNFLNLHALSSKDDFATAVVRWKLDRPDSRTKHWVEMEELLMCANSALTEPILNRASAQNKETKMAAKLTLGQIITHARLAKKMEREELAIKLDVSPGYLRSVETDRPNYLISEKLLERVAQEVDIKDDLSKPHQAHAKIVKAFLLARAERKAKQPKGDKPANQKLVKKLSDASATLAKVTPAPKPVHKRRAKAVAAADDGSAVPQ